MTEHTETLPVAIAPSDLVSMRAQRRETTIIDVRSPAEYEATHIPGSHNVPLDLLHEHGDELSGAVGGPVVLVCRSGMRASQAEQTLGDFDLPRVHVLDGGLNAWEAAGLPVKRGAQTWDMERQVRGIAGGIALAGALGGLFLWRPLSAISAGIGFGLLGSAVTNTCTMARLLGKLPYNSAVTCDLDQVIREIGAPQHATLDAPETLSRSGSSGA
jgi:rhodanese-related sulfurtransferase